MKPKIKIGICGYGNLGRGVEAEINQNPDMELVAVFTRREPAASLKIKANVPVVHVGKAAEWADKIDVMILCGGSASDLPAQGPAFAKLFNTVDSYDTHAKIPEYLAKIDEAAKAGGHIAVISGGWDPGLFSLMRLYTGAILPSGETHTFWGKGVSQGHSDAVRRVEGVANAIQYTIPSEAVMAQIRSGESVDLPASRKHKRVCYVVAAQGADTVKIEQTIKEMPDYFAGYDTTVHFITAEEMARDHSSMGHGGHVLHMGKTGVNGNSQVIEFALKLESNPEFTSSVLIALARAAYRLAEKGERGGRTIFDIPPILLSPRDAAEEIKNLL